MLAPLEQLPAARRQLSQVITGGAAAPFRGRRSLAGWLRSTVVDSHRADL